MTSQATYCIECGGSLASKEVEGTQREVCTKCDRVFYQNPLPVAASIVLNSNREILLVKRKRDPHKGEWCLPTGFAEVGETICDATLRELKEETGVNAEIVRLLSADSHTSEHYGDLLFINYEVRQIDGQRSNIA